MPGGITFLSREHRICRMSEWSSRKFPHSHFVERMRLNHVSSKSHTESSRSDSLISNGESQGSLKVGGASWQAENLKE
jgi:hypothetical protein